MLYRLEKKDAMMMHGIDYDGDDASDQDGTQPLI